ncbi:MAG: hypothetical protein LBI74_10865 [Synergistaceae bacterium]|jgi:lysyl-tRNA synthetase class 2|nr:hypothetical protein [Synergistaceae bacterium]
MPFSDITIDPEVQRAYPDVRIGVLTADIVVRSEHPYVDELKVSLAGILASRGVTEENLATQPDIAAWRSVYGAMGAKPSKYRSSLEALARRVLKGSGLWSVSSVVDCYNCASVQTFLAMGAHDTSKVNGMITLRYGRPEEKFFPLGAEGEEIDVNPRNIVYADETKICCWLWNHRDTRLAGVTDQTKEAVFIIDAAFEPHLTPVEKGIEILAGHLERIGCYPKKSCVKGRPLT